MNGLEFIKTHRIDFLNFTRTRVPLFHRSNVFHKDLKYSLQAYMLQHGYRLSDVELEGILNALVSMLISDGIFKQISDKCWTVIYPEYQTKSPGKPVFK